MRAFRAPGRTAWADGRRRRGSTQRTTLSMSSSAEIMITGMWRRPVSSLRRRSTAKPSISGIMMSSRIRSTVSPASRARASRPWIAVTASCSSSSSSCTSTSRLNGSSSTIRMRAGATAVLHARGSAHLAEADLGLRCPAAAMLPEITARTAVLPRARPGSVRRTAGTASEITVQTVLPRSRPDCRCPGSRPDCHVAREGPDCRRQIAVQTAMLLESPAQTYRAVPNGTSWGDHGPTVGPRARPRLPCCPRARHPWPVPRRRACSSGARPGFGSVRTGAPLTESQPFAP